MTWLGYQEAIGGIGLTANYINLAALDPIKALLVERGIITEMESKQNVTLQMLSDLCRSRLAKCPCCGQTKA